MMDVLAGFVSAVDFISAVVGMTLSSLGVTPSRCWHMQTSLLDTALSDVFLPKATSNSSISGARGSWATRGRPTPWWARRTTWPRRSS